MSSSESWHAFQDYLRAPYANNPSFLPGIITWHDELHRRHKNGEDLRLSYVEVQNELNDRKFEAFSLNDQIYFSHDAAVLALPHPRSTRDTQIIVPSDQKIGIWLPGYGLDEEFSRFCAEKTREVSGSQKKIEIHNFQKQVGKYRYADNVYRDVKQALGDPELPGGRANHVSEMELRFAAENPTGSGWHRDNAPKKSMEFGTCRWVRVIIIPVTRTGPLFTLDKRAHIGDVVDPEYVIPCPVGAAASFLGCLHAVGNHEMDVWGAWHRAEEHKDGRGVFVIEGANSREPFRDGPSPWKFTPAVLSV